MQPKSAGNVVPYGVWRGSFRYFPVESKKGALTTNTHSTTFQFDRKSSLRTCHYNGRSYQTSAENGWVQRFRRNPLFLKQIQSFLERDLIRKYDNVSHVP
jgi:hypothetical protein